MSWKALLLLLYTAQVCKSLRFSGVSVPRDYEQGFQRALWTFQHQRVWCPQREQLVHLRPLPQGGLAAGRCCPSSSTMLHHVTVRTVVSINLVGVLSTKWKGMKLRTCTFQPL